jgi:uncharacterized spore protein YtfJ
MTSDNKNSFQNTMDSLLKGMDSYITTKTVVGEAIHIGDTILLPLVDVSFGVAATAKSDKERNGGGGGIGGKMTPSAVLVIKDGVTKLVNIKNQDSMTKILDMVPDFVNKFTAGNGFAANGSSSQTAEETPENQSQENTEGEKEETK